jgi:RNA polymerase sigma-70 factor, ECF subfamily
MQVEPTPTTPSPSFATQQDDRRFVLAVARRIVRDEDVAADVAQDALLTAFRHRHDFRGEAHYRTWLYRIATTTALSYLRRERSRGRSMTVPLEDQRVDTLARAAEAMSPRTPEERLGDAQTAATVAEALAALPENYRSVLTLRLCDGLSTQQTARALGISVATVKIRTYRARRALQLRLRAMGASPPLCDDPLDDAPALVDASLGSALVGPGPRARAAAGRPAA